MSSIESIDDLCTMGDDEFHAKWVQPQDQVIQLGIDHDGYPDLADPPWMDGPDYAFGDDPRRHNYHPNDVDAAEACMEAQDFWEMIAWVDMPLHSGHLFMMGGAYEPNLVFWRDYPQ